MNGGPEMRPGQMYPLTGGTALFGLAVGLIGVAVTLGVVVLLKTLLGDGLMQRHSGAAAAMGAIIVGTQAMRDNPATGARWLKWLVAVVPVSAASAFGAAMAGLVTGLLPPALQNDVLGFMASVIGAFLGMLPAMYVILFRSRLFRRDANPPPEA